MANQLKVISFIDGQNLFHSAKDAFGVSYPNYDVLALSNAISANNNWQLKSVRFYTGIPSQADDPFWNYFWTHKLGHMGRQGVTVFSRELRYRNRTVRLSGILGVPEGTPYSFLAGEEKGIDVRIAIDLIRLAHQKEYDVALIFSQDQDLAEVAEEIIVIAKEQSRFIKAASAYPSSPAAQNKRGINKTDWIKIDRTLYQKCLDHRDYRPKL